MAVRQTSNLRMTVRFCLPALFARVVELVDTPGLDPGAEMHVGSSPISRTF